MLIFRAAGAFAAIPVRFKDPATRSRAAARRTRAETIPSFTNAYHDLGNIRFGVARTLINLSTPAMKGGAWQSTHITFGRDADRQAVFSTPPAVVHASDQRFFHLNTQEVVDDDVMIFRVKQLTFHDVFTEFTMSTPVSGSSSARSLDDSPVTGVEGTNATQGRIQHHCHAFIQYQSNMSAADPIYSRPLSQPLNGTGRPTRATKRPGVYGELGFAILIAMNSFTSFITGST
jgi:hypothetical protein